ncbi:phage tail assembly protein T [Cupriavidus necator]
MTVRQLLAATDSAELTEWMAYERIDPFGEGRADLRAGIIASAAANHGFVQLTEPYQPSHFMPFLKREPEAPVLLDDPQKQSALILTAVFGRKV